MSAPVLERAFQVVVVTLLAIALVCLVITLVVLVVAAAVSFISCLQEIATLWNQGGMGKAQAIFNVMLMIGVFMVASFFWSVKS